MILIHPKTKEQYEVFYEDECYISQCGIMILANLTIKNNKQYLKIHKDEAHVAFKLLEKYLFHNDTTLQPKGFTSPFFNDDYKDRPHCARVLLSDVTNNNGPHMTGMFAEFLELPSAGKIINPNTGNEINLWWYDLPQKEYYTCIDYEDYED